MSYWPCLYWQGLRLLSNKEKLVHLLLFILLASSQLYAINDIKILPVPSDTDPIIPLSGNLNIQDALILGLKHNVTLINSRESLANSTNSLKYSFEQWQPTLGSFQATYSVPYNENTNSNYPQSTITLPTITQNFPTGTSVTVNLPSYTTVRKSYALANPSKGNYGFGYPSLSVTQNLLQGSDIDVNLASLKKEIISNLKAKIAVIEQYNSTGISILKSFRDLQLEEEKVKVLSQTEKKLKTSISVVKKGIESGTKNKLDLSEKELSLKKFEIDRRTAEQNLIEQRNSFIDLLGIQTNEFPKIAAPDIRQRPTIKKADYYIDVALKYNLKLRNQQLEAESAQLTLLQSQDSARWSLSASIDVAANGKKQGSGSLSLSVPIQQTSTTNQITSDRISLLNTQRSYNKYKNYVRSTTQSKYDKLLNKIEAYKISEQRVKLSQQVTEISQLKHEQGSINALQNSDQLESHINNITSHIDTWAAMMNEYDSLLDFCGLLLPSYNIKVSDPSMNYDNYAQAIMPSSS